MRYARWSAWALGLTLALTTVARADSSVLVQAVLDVAASSHDPQAYEVCSRDFGENLGRLEQQLEDLVGGVSKMAPHESYELLRGLKPVRQQLEALQKKNASCFKESPDVAYRLALMGKQLADFELQMTSLKDAAEIGDTESGVYSGTRQAAHECARGAAETAHGLRKDLPELKDMIEREILRRGERARRALEQATGFVR